MLRVMRGFGLGIENATLPEKEKVGESRGKYFPTFMFFLNRKNAVANL